MSSDGRRYHLKARALKQQQTRDRIVAATARLHQEVGPARTTVAEIARRAGVERLTVYNNFPELTDLLRACQTHFLASHPPPRMAAGAGGPGQLTHLEKTLYGLYGWYRSNQAMEHNVNRDRQLLPELEELMRKHADPRLDAAAAGIAKTLAKNRRRRAAVRRLIRVAFEFGTWELLASGGATDKEIAHLFRQAVGGVAADSA